MYTPRLAIRHHRPVRRLLLGLVLLAALAGAGYALHETRVGALRDSLHETRQRLSRLDRGNEGLRGENAALRERVLGLERTRQVERTAYDEVDAHLRDLQDEMLSLKREVAFYRSIVAAEHRGRIAIQTLLIQPEDENAYRFELVLTRGLNDGKVLSGTVNLAVSGEHEGDRRRLGFAEISDDVGSGIAFKFRYFQRLEGRLRLPKAFVPHKVYVRVEPSEGGGRRLERAFDWRPVAG